MEFILNLKNMSLYKKYRPSNLQQVRGNEKIKETLQGFFDKQDKMPRVYLFHGQTGCGKTTFARIIKNHLEISDSDYIEINSSDHTGVDSVRTIIKNSHYLPVNSKFRMYVLDEVHRYSTAAQDALLKILEDTPKHVLFVLATTDSQKLKKALKGRCSIFQVNPLEDSEMEKLLKRTAKKEGIKLSNVVLEQIVSDSQGLPRNALQVLEQVLNVDEDKRLEIAKQSKAIENESIELCRALIGNKNWKQVSKILEGLQQQEPEGIRRHVLGYAQSVLLKADNEKAGLILEEFIEPTYNSGFSQLVLACYSVVKNS